MLSTGKIGMSTICSDNGEQHDDKPICRILLTQICPAKSNKHSRREPTDDEQEQKGSPFPVRRPLVTCAIHLYEAERGCYSEPSFPSCRLAHRAAYRSIAVLRAEVKACRLLAESRTKSKRSMINGNRVSMDSNRRSLPNHRAMLRPYRAIIASCPLNILTRLARVPAPPSTKASLGHGLRLPAPWRKSWIRNRAVTATALDYDIVLLAAGGLAMRRGRGASSRCCLACAPKPESDSEMSRRHGNAAGTRS